jgi:hypothetical protein
MPATPTVRADASAPPPSTGTREDRAVVVCAAGPFERSGCPWPHDLSRRDAQRPRTATSRRRGAPSIPGRAPRHFPLVVEEYSLSVVTQRLKSVLQQPHQPEHQVAALSNFGVGCPAAVRIEDRLAAVLNSLRVMEARAPSGWRSGKSLGQVDVARQRALLTCQHDDCF